jgi:ribosomal protein S18 acetylase RimI-like enzyme
MSGVDVRRAEGADAGAMADLLVRSHRDHRPLGATHVLADRATAVAMLDAAVAQGQAYVATDRAEVVGFFVAPSTTRQSTTARLGMAHHAATATRQRAIYRALYEVVAADLVAAGVTYHSLPVLADNVDAVSAWFELEFGVDQVDGMLAVPPREPLRTESDGVRPATLEDVDGIMELAKELHRFHTRSPMFQPPSTFDLAAIREGVENALDHERATVVVAEGTDGLVAMAQADPASAYAHTVDIGMNVVGEGDRSRGLGTALLHAVLRWSAADYRYCTVGWTSSNLMSDAFYRARGFTPVRYRLHRRIDARAVAH